MNKIFLRAKLILPALAVGVLLSGCALTDLLGGSSSIWNKDAQALNQKISCPVGGVQTPSAGAYATPTASWNQNDIIEVAFDSNGNPQPSSTNTFKYFRIDQGAKVPAYKVDFGIWTYVDKMWNGYIPIDQTKSANLAQDTMFVPLVTAARKLMTNIITPSSQNASVARWPRASQSEIYTMNKSFYFDANLSALDYYKPIKWPNVPAVIFILYLPDGKYAQLTHAERVAQIPDYQTSNALRFDVYYSVAQYNLHFNQKTCAASQHPLKLTPPQQFAYCHASQPAAGPVSKNAPSASPGVVETAFNNISKLSRCLLSTDVAYAADTSATQAKPAPVKGISWWSRAIAKIKSWFGISADPAQTEVPVAEGLPLPADQTSADVAEGLEPAPAPGEQKPPDSRTYESGEQGKNLNLPKLHKEEVAKCQEKCDLGPTNIEWPETWNPFWLMSNSNDFTRAGVACYPDPSTNPLSPKKATRTDGCGDDIKNKLCYATTPDCSLGALRCSTPSDARNATPAFSCLGDYSGQAHECGTARTEKWCANEKELQPININDIVATLTVFDKPAFSSFTKQSITQPWSSDMLNFDWVGYLTNDANRDTPRGSPSAIWPTLLNAGKAAFDGISSLWKPSLQSDKWSKALGLNVKPGTKYYSVSALQANLDPNNRGGCYNDSTFYDSKGTQDFTGIMKCAFAHAEYEVSFGDNMNSFGGSGRGNQGDVMGELGHGLLQNLGQYDPDKLAKYLKQISEWMGKMGNGTQNATKAAQNAALQAQSNANSNPYNQPNPGSEGAHPYPNTPGISEKDTNICYYTPE